MQEDFQETEAMSGVRCSELSKSWILVYFLTGKSLNSWEIGLVGTNTANLFFLISVASNCTIYCKALAVL